NTQPPEGGWDFLKNYGNAKTVSTHSRPKAAGNPRKIKGYAIAVSTHSRPKAAGYIKSAVLSWLACFNTQPPEGG
ncbi:hypothetical protein, partial [Neisseria sp. HMSC061H08]|uniref:hypothetical protein n=1 Tax=Neisseria sp. HMSC061H08 TaxID=1715154 RepID=UPI001AEF4F3D